MHDVVSFLLKLNPRAEVPVLADGDLIVVNRVAARTRLHEWLFPEIRAGRAYCPD